MCQAFRDTTLLILFLFTCLLQVLRHNERSGSSNFQAVSSKNADSNWVGRLSATILTQQSFSPGTIRPVVAANTFLDGKSLARRELSSYVLDGFGGGGRGGGGGGTWQWPTITKSNTIFNIVPQGHKYYVVERFGKLHSVQDSGWFLAIPLINQIAYVVDVRERAMDIPPQSAITRDNVSVEVLGNLFIKFQDPVAAAYGALNPLYSAVIQVRIRN